MHINFYAYFLKVNGMAVIITIRQKGGMPFIWIMWWWWWWWWWDDLDDSWEGECLQDESNLFSYTTIGRKSQKKQRDDFKHLFNHFHQPPKSKKEIQNTKQRKKTHTHTHTKKNLSNVLKNVFFPTKTRASLSFTVPVRFPRFSQLDDGPSVSKSKSSVTTKISRVAVSSKLRGIFRTQEPGPRRKILLEGEGSTLTISRQSVLKWRKFRDFFLLILFWC